MFHRISPADTTAALPVHEVFRARSQAFSSAAVLLGGRSGARLVDTIAQDLVDSPVISLRTRRSLGKLLSLLSLENVHVLGSEEAACFAEIAPWDPVVDEICSLTERLRNAVRESDAMRGNGIAGHYRAA